MNLKKTTGKYTLWNNCLYTFRNLKKKEGAGAIAVCSFDLVLGILQPFLEAALAGAVAACLVSGRRPEEILLLVAGYVLLLQTVRFLRGNVNVRRRQALNLHHMDTFEEYYRKTLEMDGQCLESAEGRKKWAAAKNYLYWGSYKGVEAYIRSALDTVFNLAGLILYGVIVGRKSLVLLILLTAQTTLSFWLKTRAKKKAEGMEDEKDDLSLHFQYLRRESVLAANGKDIRLYRMDAWFLRAFQEIIGRIRKLTDRQQNYYTAAGIANHIFSFARNAFVYGWLIREMALQRMTLPTFLLYIGIVSGFETWINNLLDAFTWTLVNDEIVAKYRDFMDYGIVEEGRPAPAHAGRVHEIRLENVSFRYEGSEEDTIKNMNLTIRAGEKLALVGLNGAGKTTLVKLLCGLYRPTSGRIFLDGEDIGALSQWDVFKEFSIVFQDVFAFSFPLSENVTCVREGEEDREKLQKSLEEAGLWEKAQSLPKKEKTSMNKDMDKEGVTLSGGELQKLMLARALYKDAPVVILDEPTAALDPIAESELYEKYDGMIRGKTAVFISHRLSSTRFCDRILYMENGRILEEGNHEKLMRAGGAYAELFSLQAQYYQKNAEPAGN